MRLARFLWEFFKNPGQIGAVATSSKRLAELMGRHVNSKNVAELGGGTGSVTHKILKYLPEDGHLTCLEINPRLCNYLRKIKDDRLEVVNDDAENLGKYLSSSDCVVSCLPLTVINKSKREKILAASSQAKRFIQFQYSPFLRKELGRYFSRVRTRFVFWNIPCAFVYICSNGVNKNHHNSGKLSAN